MASMKQCTATLRQSGTSTILKSFLFNVVLGILLEPTRKPIEPTSKVKTGYCDFAILPECTESRTSSSVCDVSGWKAGRYESKDIKLYD